MDINLSSQKIEFRFQDQNKSNRQCIFINNTKLVMELMVFLMIFPIGGSTRISTRLMTRAGRPARRVAGPGRVAKNFAMQFPTLNCPPKQC